MSANHLPVRELLSKLTAAGRSCTLLGVGPVSPTVVRGTFEACRNYDCPPIFIASRNQVDLESLGHGYLMGGMDQKKFVELVHTVGGEVGYAGPIYICRDHGGPWQRNVELDERYEVDRAMEIAKVSFRADIEAGFNYLHIDPTKCPHPFTQDQLVEWTVELMAFCEEVRRSLGAGEIDYEVGTEDIQGGLTTDETFGEFLTKLTARLKADDLPAPTTIVGQTGTLCKVDHNVGHFSQDQTRRLVKIAADCGIGFKEHNGDYLSAATCRIHPELGVSGMNVAPEFGLVETDACLHLAALEAKLVGEGWVAEDQASGFKELIRERTFADSPWGKWMTDEIKALPAERIEADDALRLLISRVCGHYVYPMPAVAQARKTLFANIDRHKLVDSAEQFVTSRVREAIEYYLEPFALKGVNSLI